MKAPAEGKLKPDIPRVARDDKVGAKASTSRLEGNAVRIRELEKSEAETPRHAPRPTAAVPWKTSPVISSAASTASSARVFGRGRHAVDRAVDDLHRERCLVAGRDRRCGLARPPSNVGTVAAAAEELSSSVTEISREVDALHRDRERGVSDAERTNATVQELSTGAEKIGEVVS